MDIMPFGLLGLGFLLGIKHAFDADHVAAVSTIISKHKSIKKSFLLGMFWGFGHTISLLCASLIILLLKITIPEKIALSFELAVGIMLVILGLNVLLTTNKIHFHRHKHGKERHFHFHSHKLTKHHGHKHKLFHQSLSIGLIHGLAGSAVLTLPILATIKSVWLVLIYILIFGIGSITGMILISGVISLPFTLIPNNLQRTQKFLRVSAGLISMIIGLNIMHNTGIAGGLLI